MDIRERHFGRISTDVGDAERSVIVDVGSLVRRLVLFEQCTVETTMLKEIPALVDVFGLGGLLTLLESGVLRLVCDALTAGEAGEVADLFSTVKRGGPLPLGSYMLASITLPKEGEFFKGYIHESLQEVHKSHLSFKDQKKLKKELARRLVLYPPDVGLAGVNDTRGEILEEHPVIWSGIRLAAIREKGIDPGTTPRFDSADLGDDDFRVMTNLRADFGLSPEDEHAVVKQGLLAVAGMNQRVHLMDSFEAVTGFQSNDVSLFEAKLSLLARQLDPTVQEQRFERVATIGGLPGGEGFPAGARIDVDRLMKLRDDPECREVRRWLRNIDSETDEEINERFEDLRGRLASVIEGPTGRAVRFLIASGAGAIPVVGVGAGPAFSAIDSFLLEKIIGKPGPATFLSRHYPSIFEM